MRFLWSPQAAAIMCEKNKKTLKKFILGEGEKLRGGFVTSCQV
jgi:hypothetical protein